MATQIKVTRETTAVYKTSAYRGEAVLSGKKGQLPTTELRRASYSVEIFNDWSDGDVEVYSPDMHSLFLLMHSSVDSRLVVDASSENSARLGSGALVIVPAGKRARWRWSGMNRELMKLQFRSEALQDQHLEHGQPHLKAGMVRNDALLHQLCSAIADELNEGALHNTGSGVEDLVSLISKQLIKRHGSPSPQSRDQSRGGLASWQLRRVKNTVESADERLSLGQMAEMVSVSTTHFCTAFKKSTGVSPHKWQIHRRTERASRLLKNLEMESFLVLAVVVGAARWSWL